MERWLKTLGEMAIYKNKEYEFIYALDFSHNIKTRNHSIFSYQEKSDLENGFSGADPASGRLIKHVPLEDLSFVFEKETTAIYKGDLFGADFIRGKEIMLSAKDRDPAEPPRVCRRVIHPVN